jgi:hypothetical protein
MIFKVKDSYGKFHLFAGFEEISFGEKCVVIVEKDGKFLYRQINTQGFYPEDAKVFAKKHI